MQLTRRSLRRRLSDEEGVALVISLMATTLMTALGLALILMTMTEGTIASNYRDGSEALYAADAAIERAMQDLLAAPDWDNVLTGGVTSTFVDGPPAGIRELPGGRTLDLTQATNAVRCGKPQTCSDADMTTTTDERPWARNNPRWQLYAYGPLTGMLPFVSIDSSMYVVVWVADDPSENDDDPLRDGLPCVAGGACVNIGKGVIAVRAQAYGPGAMMRAIEATLARTTFADTEGVDEGPRRAGVRVLSWREIR